jgi:RNA polymerase sigma-70 factor (ECF subfamily)
MDINTAQFEAIYDEFAPRIFKFCYFRVSSREEAEDIASLTFIRAWDHVQAGKDVMNVQGFLYRIANNLIIDFYRKKKDKRDLSLDDPKNPIDIPETANFVEALNLRMTVNQVQATLAKLHDNYRDVIVMKYINDLSIKEIAAALETSENNISVRLHRAVEKLKQLM